MSDTKELEIKKPAYLANANPLDNDCPVQQEDIRVPSIVISQPASKALVDGDEAYIDGLKAGQFYNSSSRKIYGKTMRVQFIHYFKMFNVFKGTPAAPEWVESLSEPEFLKLRSREFREIGIMTPDKPDCFIKETWRFVVNLSDDNTMDFVFLNFKPGGISDAKIWVNQMYEAFKKGEDVLSIEWELNTYSKESKTANASSYQVEGSRIKRVGFVDEARFNKAHSIRNDIKVSQAQLMGEHQEY